MATGMNEGEYFNLNYLASICDSDWQFMKEMIETFLRDAPVIIAGMQEKAGRKEWMQVRESAHKFKTSLMFMGIQSLHVIIREIEQSGLKEPDTGQIPEKIEQVNDICNKARVELRNFLASHP